MQDPAAGFATPVPPTATKSVTSHTTPAWGECNPPINQKSKPKKTQSKPKSKPKSGGLFGSKRPKKTYEGEPGGKADWFLEEALDTVYDPHGTGKTVKAAAILARSSDGNVRVRDVVRAYALQGRDGISELAWTSPITEYLIEAFDAC